MSPALFLLKGHKFDGCTGKSYKYANDATLLVARETAFENMNDLQEKCGELTSCKSERRLDIAATYAILISAKSSLVQMMRNWK